MKILCNLLWNKTRELPTHVIQKCENRNSLCTCLLSLFSEYRKFKEHSCKITWASEFEPVCDVFVVLKQIIITSGISLETLYKLVTTKLFK